MRRNVLESILGGVVLVIAAIFLVFAYSSAQIRSVEGYPVKAKFSRIDGIQTGSDVRISGIRIGSVTGTTLDSETFLAVVHMSIKPSVQLPTDTVAKITSAGLLSDKYLALDPGGALETIQPGGEIRYTQSAIALEDLIGQYIFGSQKSGGESGGPGK